MSTARLSAAFAKAKAEGRAALVAYVMAGDPDLATCGRILAALPAAGVDVIELGFPFTDPMADGPVIQRAGIRALKNGVTLAKTLALVEEFRAGDAVTPLVVMGYLNPIETMGHANFARRAADSGVDGAIIVDAPPEEDAPLRAAMAAHDLALIRLATPTTDAARLPAVVEGVSGFVYYVAVAGITGDKAIQLDGIAAAVDVVRGASGLPVVVGFGIRTPQAAAETARIADGVAVGTALVDAIAKAAEDGRDPAAAGAAFARALSDAILAVRQEQNA
jgi:tryptophan synthase alpha chain